MAGQVRHLKVKGGRFYARIAVPKALQPIIGKSELTAPIGGDRRAAMRALPGAVTVLQHQITQAERKTGQRPDVERYPLTHGQLAASLYSQRIAADDHLRNNPGWSNLGIDDLFVSRLRDASAGKATNAELVDLVGHQVERFRQAGNLTAEPGSDEWRGIARALAVAEQALARRAERDEGDFAGKPENPLMVNAEPIDDDAPPVPLRTLFKDYITARQALGKHRDGGRSWENAIADLVRFAGHSDARKITKRNLLDWRDHLLSSGKAPKTIANGYLAAVRAVFSWAHENDRLPVNVAETVRQEVPKVQHSRERGYTDKEAAKVLNASVNYRPPVTDNPSNRESPFITAAERWLPILCAFTGARVAEMAQLRKSDVRQEDGCWIVRVSPDAGSVKAGGFRDIPVHRQLVELGFLDFVKAAKDGPLFHNATKPECYLASARATAGRVSQWLQEQELVPEGVQPSHGWRHRLKTRARELGADSRVTDAIQGHARRTAGDKYGDVSVAAKARVIDMLPDYKITKC